MVFEDSAIDFHKFAKRNAIYLSLLRFLRSLNPCFMSVFYSDLETERAETRSMIEHFILYYVYNFIYRAFKVAEIFDSIFITAVLGKGS